MGEMAMFEEKLNWWSKNRAQFVDARVWIVFRRDRSPNFFVAGLNQSDPRHEHALTNHITGFDLVSICTYWITFPFRYLLFGHYHMTHIYRNYDVTDCNYHVTRKNSRGRISQNLRAHTILITWRVSVCSIVCLIITNINNIKSYSFSCQWANCSF